MWPGLYFWAMLTRKMFYFLGLITLLGFSALGLAVIGLFQPGSPWRIFTEGSPIGNQVLRGLLFGAIAVLNLLWLIHTPLLKSAREFFSNLIGDAGLRVPDMLFVSLAAGIGEEILFRAAIQPFLGIWPTALIFVVMHGYITPKNWRMSIYGVLLIVVSAGLGYLYEHVGLYASMTAHFIIDFVLFIHFRYQQGVNQG